METAILKDLFQSVKAQLEGNTHVALLKKIEEVTDTLFSKNEVFKSQREVLGTDNESINKVLQAALHSNFEGIEEFSEDFYKVLQVASNRQTLTRYFIRAALDEFEHGFNEFDKTLLWHSTIISDLYDPYYMQWSQAVRKTEAAERIMALQDSDSIKLGEIILEKKLDNFYTIITHSNPDDEFSDVPYATYFATALEPILNAFDEAVNSLEAIENLNEQQKILITYLKKYRYCLSEKDKENLEDKWAELDEIWVNSKYYMQVVHDIEYGYGDPLRTKVIPDFSIRFIDYEYAKQNEDIDTIHEYMIEYFNKRDSQVAREGMFALRNSHAAIYYLPFHCGMSLHFRFSGQSIPNRTEIRNTKGVKIYFDPVSTAARIEKVEKLVKRVFADHSLVNYLDSIDTIVNHVAAHEFGHAIYGLDGMRDVITIGTKSLLEEPRAELTTLTFLHELHSKGYYSNKQLEQTMFNFVASDLRRFAMYDSQSTRPYTISAINCYNVYEQTGYLTLEGDTLSVHHEKIQETLQILRDQFEKILEAEDNKDGDYLESILKQMENEGTLVRWLVKKLNN